MKLFKLGLVAAALTASIAPANSFEPSVAVGAQQFTIGVVGYVPVICRANVDANLDPASAGE